MNKDHERLPLIQGGISFVRDELDTTSNPSSLGDIEKGTDSDRTRCPVVLRSSYDTKFRRYNLPCTFRHSMRPTVASKTVSWLAE